MFSISLLFLVFPIFPFSQFLIFCYFTWRNGIHIYSMFDQIQSGRLCKTDYCGLTCAINTHQRFTFSTGLTGHVDDFATLSMSNHLLSNCLENFKYYVCIAYIGNSQVNHKNHIVDICYRTFLLPDICYITFLLPDIMLSDICYRTFLSI